MDLDLAVISFFHNSTDDLYLRNMVINEPKTSKSGLFILIKSLLTDMNSFAHK